MQTVARPEVLSPPIAADPDDPSSWSSVNDDGVALDRNGRDRSERHWLLPVIDQHDRNKQTTLFFELSEFEE